MARIVRHPVPIEFFHYDTASARLSEEISTFNANYPGAIGRIYNDACDEGLTIKGKEKHITFFHYDTVRDGEGDILYWIFKPIAEEKHLVSKDLHLILYND